MVVIKGPANEPLYDSISETKKIISALLEFFSLCLELNLTLGISIHNIFSLTIKPKNWKFRDHNLFELYLLVLIMKFLRLTKYGTWRITSKVLFNFTNNHPITRINRNSTNHVMIYLRFLITWFKANILLPLWIPKNKF